MFVLLAYSAGIHFHFEWTSKVVGWAWTRITLTKFRRRISWEEGVVHEDIFFKECQNILFLLNRKNILPFMEKRDWFFFTRPALQKYVCIFSTQHLKTLMVERWLNQWWNTGSTGFLTMTNSNSKNEKTLWNKQSMELQLQKNSKKKSGNKRRSSVLPILTVPRTRKAYKSMGQVLYC